ncbi:MAG: ATP-binding protein [Thermoanaerobaculia bacterium]
MDSVFLHDMKNLEFRLNLLLSNLEEHYGDPDFKRSVVELLQSSLQKVDTVVERWSAHKDAVMIKVPVDINELVADAANRVRARDSYRQNGASAPNVGFAAEPLPPVWADPHYLSDAFASIVQNALEAAGPGGQVSLESRLESHRGSPWVAVGIADSGPGMSREFIRTRLFRPFQTMKTYGIGLGLFTAREIIRAHRGQVTVDSRLGEGTLVTVRLRAEREDASR